METAKKRGRKPTLDASAAPLSETKEATAPAKVKKGKRAQEVAVDAELTIATPQQQAPVKRGRKKIDGSVKKDDEARENEESVDEINEHIDNMVMKTLMPYIVALTHMFDNNPTLLKLIECSKYPVISHAALAEIIKSYVTN